MFIKLTGIIINIKRLLIEKKVHMILSYKLYAYWFSDGNQSFKKQKTYEIVSAEMSAHCTVQTRYNSSS
jgi:hypothetical protein